MKEVLLSCIERKEVGKEKVKKLRCQGFIPGVVYGSEIENILLSVPEKELKEIIYDYGTSCIVNLRLESGEIPTIIKDIQRDYLGKDIIHVDFLKIHKKKEIELTIPVVHIGRPAGEIDGGILEQHIYNVRVKSLPENIPPRLEVDVSDMKLGDNLTMGVINLPEGVILLESPEIILFTLIPPKGIIEEEEKAVIEEEVKAEGEEKESEKEK
ncbi:MAG: 50S ribosomal protein L25 [bacterium]